MYKIINFDTLPSTNKYLKENYQNYNEYTVVSTYKQTEGKGRENKKWLAENNKNITFSILLKPTIDTTKLPLITLIAGASVRNVISKYHSSEIKWPNDIIVNNKKISGILVESIISNKIEALIVGIGINSNQEQFDSSIQSIATSLKIVLGKEIDNALLINQVIIEFDRLYKDFLNNGKEFLDVCRKYNYLQDRKIYHENNEYIVKDINDIGNLVVSDTNNCLKELFYGEVTLSNIY